jgi:hypothetical protein
MFGTRYAQSRSLWSRNRYISTEGFGDLGLGQPSTLWLASDQVDPGTYIVTRYGFGWTPLQAGGGSLAKQFTWLNGEPVVQIVNGGTAVATGLSCDSMAGGEVDIQFDYTWSCPILWPAAFATTQIIFNLGSAITSPAFFLRPFLSSDTTYQVSAVVNSAAIIPPFIGSAPSGFNTTLTRRGLVVVTSQIRGGNRVWQLKVRTQGVTLDRTSPPIVSVATNPNPLNSFHLGFGLSGNSSNLGFGGACCWKGIGASDAQLTAILDTWQNLYPLV